MQRYALFVVLPLMTFGASCTQFPELDSALSAQAHDADYVPLIELDPSAPVPATTQAQQQTDPLVARAANLSRRADALRARSVLPSDVRARIRDR